MKTLLSLSCGTLFLLVSCGKEEVKPAAVELPKPEALQLDLQKPADLHAQRLAAQQQAQQSGLLLLNPGDKLEVPVHPGNAEKTFSRTAADGTTEIVFQAGGKESVYRQAPQTPEIRGAARSMAMDEMIKARALPVGGGAPIPSPSK